MFVVRGAKTRRFLHLTVLGAIVLSVLAFARPASAVGDVELRGTARLLVADTFAPEHSHAADVERWVLDTPGGAVPFTLPTGTSMQPGQRVRLHGAFRGDTFAATGGVASQAVSAQSLRPFSGTKRLAVIMLNFTSDQSRPYTDDLVRDLVFDAADSTAAFYHAASDGGLTLEGDVFDWVTINRNAATCNVTDWATAALAKAGVDEYDYDNVMFTFPSQDSCAWWGLGFLPGRWSWVNGTPLLQVAAHELGHNYGAHHANALHCTGVGDVGVALSSTCESWEYGDPFSVMGYSATHLHHNWHRAQMNYMDSSQTITAPGTFPLAPSEQSNATAPRLLRVPRGDGTYFHLEFRRPDPHFDLFSANHPTVNGVTIRLAPDEGVIVQSQLLDCAPQTAHFEDSACIIGQTFVDPVTGLQITATAKSAGNLIVRVEFAPDVTAPSTPSNVKAKVSGPKTVGLSWASATDNAGVAGYRVYRDGKKIATTAATKYSDKQALPGTTNKYTVAAYDASGNESSRSAIVNARTPRLDKQAPTVPGAPVAYTYAGVVVIKWNASTDNVGVAGYRLYRNGVTKAQGPNGSAVDLPGKGRFRYSIAAYDAAGNVSGRSRTVQVKL
jgi:hypothetical protein